MNTVTPERTEKVTKSLAILGFFAVIGFIAWASVAIVNYAPKAFSSLASIAQSINNYKGSVGQDTTLTITSDVVKTTVGTPATVSWEKAKNEGTYSFSYQCIDGVALDVVDTEGLRSITCDTAYNLGDIDKVTVVAESKKEKEIALNYTVSYTSDSGVEPARKVDGSLTIVNESVGAGDVLASNDTTDWKDVVPTKPITNTVVEVVPKDATPAPAPANEPKPTTPIVTTPGYSDLSARFLSTGIISGNTYTAKTITKSDEAAFQFAVTNLGTKASAPWSYTVTLPVGDTYTSPTQNPLIPGEEARIALGFPITESTTYKLVVVVATTGETNLQNNNFTQSLTFNK
jgi:hypothetical protein